MAQARPNQPTNHKISIFEIEEQLFNSLFNPPQKVENINHFLQDKNYVCKINKINNGILNFLIKNQVLVKRETKNIAENEVHYEMGSINNLPVTASILNNLYVNLSKVKEPSEPLIVSETNIQCIYEFIYNTIEDLIKNPIKNHEEVVRVLYPIINLSMFLHSHCWVMHNDQSSISKYKLTVNILSYYRLLTDSWAALNKPDKVEICLQRLKRLTKDSFSTKPMVGILEKEDIQNKIYCMGSYYKHTYLIASQRKNFSQAKKYALKLLQLDDMAAENGYLTSENYIPFFKKLMDDCLAKNQLEEALFWANCVATLIPREIKRQIDLMTRGLISQSDAQEQNKKYEFQKGILKKIINDTKKKILAIKIEAIKNIFKEIGIIAEFECLEKNSIKIKFIDTELLSFLTKMFRSCGYVCAYDAKSSSISIYNIIDINIEETLPKAIKKWQRLIFENKVPKTTATNQESLTLSTSSVSTSQESAKSQTSNSFTSTYNLNKALAKTKRKNKSKPTDNAEPVSKVDTTIKWPKKNICYKKGMSRMTDANNKKLPLYHLYGNTTIRHYLFLNSNLVDHVSNDNPLGMKNLVNMCKRGKVINRSKGNKGILIKGTQVKIKDCSKGYRFYGTVVDVVETTDGKKHNLIEINGYTPDKKSKKPITFSS